LKEEYIYGDLCKIKGGGSGVGGGGGRREGGGGRRCREA